MPIISVVAAVQTSEALKLLTGHQDRLHGSLMQFDVWQNEWRKINLPKPVPECSSCGQGLFPALDAESRELSAVLCGRNAVQITHAAQTELNLNALAERLRPLGNVQLNAYLLRFNAGEYEVTVFRDARAIIRGTDDPSQARSLYAKYIGT